MLKKVLVILTGIILLIGCNSTKRDPNSPQKPYKSWRLAGSHPEHFGVEVRDAVIRTQSQQIYSSAISVSKNKGGDKWTNYPGGVGGLSQYSDLPTYIGVCWMSFFDQKVYWTEIELPLEVRQMMIQSETRVAASGYSSTFYSNRIVLGFEPKGHVKVWLTGIPVDKAPLVAEADSLEITNNNHYCGYWPRSGRIPQISDEAKAWIKANGVPEKW